MRGIIIGIPIGMALWIVLILLVDYLASFIMI
jgi:hypothetical protein